jgi:hypothetical protein
MSYFLTKQDLIFSRIGAPMVNRPDLGDRNPSRYSVSGEPGRLMNIEWRCHFSSGNKWNKHKFSGWDAGATTGCPKTTRATTSKGVGPRGSRCTMDPRDTYGELGWIGIVWAISCYPDNSSGLRSESIIGRSMHRSHRVTEKKWGSRGL